ncbi:MAG: C40 family peptidase [Eubacterium sp.]|nr:C40 family peptidase [Eubacterium sp.]MDD7209777.1 SH3 domain-containing C40 family peptidase [Lachnospiraceae bacterium]MDY5496778.1 SH3 domain-containing C40 family peptidase [Anaerobutyricum sp.]
MLNKLKRFVIIAFTAVFILNISPLAGVKSVGEVEAATAMAGTVSSTNLDLRARKSAKSDRIAVLHKGNVVSVLTFNKKWVKVQINGITGYVKGKYIALPNGATASNTAYISKGQQVANYAVKFVGNPYRWGGSSLTRGTDCSGFVMSVYKKFGKSLPHSSYGQRRCGKKVRGLRNAKAGDIICYSGHVAIYMGNNTIVHASNPREGIKITRGAAYRSIVTIRRMF